MPKIGKINPEQYYCIQLYATPYYFNDNKIYFFIVFKLPPNANIQLSVL